MIKRVLLAVCFLVAGNARAEPPAILEVTKIWSAAPHNAFTDLTRWHDRWWCTFRESEAHVGGDGKIRVIVSGDGHDWQSAALLDEPGIDLRDPKFSVTPDDRLMLVMGGSVYEGTKTLKGRQPRVSFSKEGSAWSPPKRVLKEGDWLWRVTWHGGVAYGTTYTSIDASGKAVGDWPLRLVSSPDGVEWTTLSSMEVSGQPNETTLRFTDNGTVIAMVRRDAGATRVGWLGTAAPPYVRWTWHESNYQFGGPNCIELPTHAYVATTRDYTVKGKFTTLVAGMTLDGTLTPLATLPSGGDNSYAGMVYHEGQLWISYYSSHEGKTSIYLAKVKLPG